MLRLTICEDEQILAQRVADLVGSAFPSLQIQCLTSGKELLQAEPSELYILDIHLQDANGLELAKTIRAQQPQAQIIFLTAHAQYVFDAFDVEPLHYLLKPVDEEKLRALIEKALLKYTNATVKNQFIVQVGNEKIIINEEELFFAEAQGRKITLHFNDKTITYYGKISTLEQQLNGPFFRSHRSYLVHFKQIKRFDQTTIVFVNDTVAFIARNRYKLFVTAFSHYAQEHIQ